MSVFQWKDDFSVGVSELDEQHKTLIRLVNQMHQAMTQKKGDQILEQTISNLKKYAQKHFTTEEKYMSRYGYPDLQEHKRQHDKFIEKVMDFDLELKDGNTLITLEVWRFLRNWLSDHILKSDKLYAPTMKKHGLE